jgi:hypothetical protein
LTTRSSEQRWHRPLHHQRSTRQGPPRRHRCAWSHTEGRCLRCDGGVWLAVLGGRAHGAATEGSCGTGTAMISPCACVTGLPMYLCDRSGPWRGGVSNACSLCAHLMVRLLLRYCYSFECCAACAVRCSCVGGASAPGGAVGVVQQGGRLLWPGGGWHGAWDSSVAWTPVTVQAAV